MEKNNVERFLTWLNDYITMQAQEIDILKYNMLEKNLLSAFVLAVHIGSKNFP